MNCNRNMIYSFYYLYENMFFCFKWTETCSIPLKRELYIPNIVGWIFEATYTHDRPVCGAGKIIFLPKAPSALHLHIFSWKDVQGYVL